MNLRQRSHTKELLDADDIPFEHIKQNMQELNFINTWLGGHSISIAGLKKLIAKRTKISVCEIGCGGGDNLSAIVKWCAASKISVTCTGVDIKEECISFARQNELLKNYTTWLTSDYADIHFDVKPDIIFSSLFCHHFTEEQLVRQILWMKENSGIGFFINDLQRHHLAYSSIKILTRLFSSSYLVKNDAPLSVARGFKKQEWNNIFSLAGIQHYSVQWKWAFRYLVVCIND